MRLIVEHNGIRASFDVPGDNDVIDLVNLIWKRGDVFPSLVGRAFDLAWNGHRLVVHGSNLTTKLKAFGFPNDTVLTAVLFNDKDSVSMKQSTSSLSNKHQPSSTVSQLQALSPNEVQELTRREFETLKVDRATLFQYKLTYPKLATAFESNCDDFNKFSLEYAKQREDARHKRMSMLDETSKDGQTFLAEHKRLKKLVHLDRFATKHLAHTAQRWESPHLVIRVNGFEMVSLVDTGANMSSISLNLAKRSRLHEHMDHRFYGRVYGVGGSAAVLGKIRACHLRIGQVFDDHFAMKVVEKENIDCVLGMDFLGSNGCMLDLGRNLMLVRGQEIPFLTPAQLAREMIRLTMT